MSKSVLSRRQFWLTHRERAQAEGLSLHDYAQRECLSLASLYAVRPVRQEASPIPPAVPAFTAVHISQTMGCELSLPGGLSIRLPELPSPAWLARLQRELAS